MTPLPSMSGIGPRLSLGRVGLGRVLQAAVLTVALAAAGAERDGAVVRSSSRIQELHLFTMPSALDLDAQPGPDGFEVRVYASTAEKAKGLPINQGRLEVLMWDGVLSAQKSATNKPLHVWSLKPEELKRFSTQTSLGVGYRLTLRWEEHVPKKEGFTVVARFFPTKGDPVYSTPSGIAMSQK
ncbi:MAG: hypothetical protein JNN07_09215 [Verrucomicrobiales bacterium]|nr:hypothetical protein [Verrucomicrobiales bacterium]